MKWLDEYNIGVEEIDSQHQELYQILTKLKQSFSKEEDAAETIKFLVDYTNRHFSSEEKFMQDIGYPEYEAHKENHGKCLNTVAEILVAIKQGRKLDVSYLTQFLTDWLLTHVLEEDNRIGVFHRKNNS